MEKAGSGAFEGRGGEPKLEGREPRGEEEEREREAAEFKGREAAFLFGSKEPTTLPGVRESRKRSSMFLSFTRPKETEASLRSAPQFRMATKTGPFPLRPTSSSQEANLSASWIKTRRKEAKYMTIILNGERPLRLCLMGDS
jgi:hypothetical protein